MNLDARGLNSRRIIGSLLDDRTGTIRQGRLIPVKEDQIRTRRSRCWSGYRCWRRRRRWWRGSKVIAHAEQERVVQIVPQLELADAGSNPAPWSGGCE